MALEFLGDLTKVASGVGGLLDAFGVGKPKLNYGPTPSEARANSLFQALLDPENSLVKQNTDINFQRGMHDILAALQMAQLRDRRSMVRGIRPSFFNPERADENINFLLTRQAPAIADEARKTARNDIFKTASALQGFTDGEQKRINAQNTNAGVDYQNFQTQGGYGGMAKRFGGGLEDLIKVLMPQSRAPQSQIYHY